MPKSRGRRRRKSSRAVPGNGRAGTDLRARAIAELPILRATDQAEARGDASAALDIIGRDLQRRGDEFFWRPERTERLAQLTVLAATLPRWATSRWILAQAAQCLDERGRGRALKALEIAIAARGGESALVGTDAVDAKAKVIDNDWLYRQVLLYELGGLQYFVDRVASPDLLAGADRIRGWARAPMGGFRLIDESPLMLTWSDLATGEDVESLNLGAATWLEPGECAIGRLVPVDEGAMFESAPLVVPDRVAERVADDPADWVATLSVACREPGRGDERIYTATGHDFRLLTDVPAVVQQVVAMSAVEGVTGERAVVESVADVTALEVGLVRAALDDRLDDLGLPWSPWPSVAATIVLPSVVLGLWERLRASDGPELCRLASLLAGPAADVCLELARGVESVA